VSSLFWIVSIFSSLEQNAGIPGFSGKLEEDKEKFQVPAKGSGCYMHKASFMLRIEGEL
jgi:hypothetical protein